MGLLDEGPTSLVGRRPYFPCWKKALLPLLEEGPTPLVGRRPYSPCVHCKSCRK